MARFCIDHSHIFSLHLPIAPPEFSHENADAPPMGFAFVLGGKVAWGFTEPPDAIDAGRSFAVVAGVGDLAQELLSGPPLRRRPSSKNLLRPSLGLAAVIDAAGALELAVEEAVRLVIFGLRTLIPVSLR